MNTKKSKKKDLFILPSFFSTFFIGDSKILDDDFDSESLIDLYTQFRKNTGENLSSKFKEVRYIPMSESILDYESDIWDFSYYSYFYSSRSKFIFTLVPECLKNDVKDFLLLLILRDNCKISTLNLYVSVIKRFVKFLYNQGVYKMSDISFYDIEKFIKSRTIKDITQMKEKNIIEQFLQLYELENSANIYTSEVSELLSRMDINLYKSITKKNKRKPINVNYFDSLLIVLIRQMDDINQPTSIRALAAMLIIDSQTGLRASELSLLLADSVESINIEGILYRTIKYKIIKTAKGNRGFKFNTTFINELSFKAYELIMELHKDNRKIRNSDLLYCPLNISLPALPYIYMSYLKKVCILNTDEIGSRNSYLEESMSSVNIITFLNHEYNGRPIYETPLKTIENLTEETVFYYPVLHQFRNTVVDRLIKSGVKPEFTRLYMGHLSVEMTASYSDYNDTHIQENIAFSEKILRTYLTEEARILGSSGNMIMDRINEWIKENNLNVAKDLDEIIDKLLDILPIRSKHGGVCIKGTKMTNACSVDSKTDEFFCAYGVCPNVCHFYFMLNITYIDFKEAVKIINYNRNNGFERQAEKELNKLKYLILNRLNPEILELEREISIKGIDIICYRHPELIEIITDLFFIKQEICKWS